MQDDIFERIKHENLMINNRLTWLGVFNGILFVAFSGQTRNHSYIVPSFIICAIGLAVSLSIWVGTYRANCELNKLDQNNNKGRLCYLMPGYAIPPFFVVAWFSLAIWVMFS